MIIIVIASGIAEEVELIVSSDDSVEGSGVLVGEVVLEDVVITWVSDTSPPVGVVLVCGFEGSVVVDVNASGAAVDDSPGGSTSVVVLIVDGLPPAVPVLESVSPTSVSLDCLR